MRSCDLQTSGKQQFLAFPYYVQFYLCVLLKIIRTFADDTSDSDCIDNIVIKHLNWIYQHILSINLKVRIAPPPNILIVVLLLIWIHFCKNLHYSAKRSTAPNLLTFADKNCSYLHLAVLNYVCVNWEGYECGYILRKSVLNTISCR